MATEDVSICPKDIWFSTADRGVSNQSWTYPGASRKQHQRRHRQTNQNKVSPVNVAAAVIPVVDGSLHTRVLIGEIISPDMLSNIEPLAREMTVNICRRAGSRYWGLGGPSLALCSGNARGRRNGRGGGMDTRQGLAPRPCRLSRESRQHVTSIYNIEPSRGLRLRCAHGDNGRVAWNHRIEK